MTKANGGAEINLDFARGGSPHFSAAKSNPLPPLDSPHLANAMWACLLAASECFM